MKKLVIACCLVLVSAAAQAVCIKCDQTTGWRCYMSTYGTKTNCDSPSDAGCFTWGVCTHPSECTDPSCDVYNRGRLRRLSDDLHLASVTVTVPIEKLQNPRDQKG